MKRKISLVIFLIVLLSLLVSSCDYIHNVFFRYATIKLDKEPDSIISNSSTNLLAIITDGQLCLYDENGQKRDIPTPFNVINVYQLDNFAMVIDESNNLYAVDYSSDDIIISNIILNDIISVEASANYNLDDVKERSFIAVNKNGEVYVWGNNDEYILGLTTTNYIDEPTKLNYIGGVKKVHLSNRNAILLTNEGKVYQSGLEKYEGEVPVYYEGFTLMNFPSGVTDIYKGYHTFVIYKENIICWEYGEYTNHINDKINDSCREHNITTFSTGCLFNMGMSKSGDVYVWGNNIIERATHKADDTYIYLPKKVKGINDADMIYAGVTVGYVRKDSKIYVLKK